MTKTVKNKKKIFSLIGLATRARKTVSGEFATEKAVKSFKACLVIVAEDASDNTKKLFQDKCSFYEVPCYVCGTKEELAHAMGKEVRASLAVTDEGFADAIINYLPQVIMSQDFDSTWESYTEQYHACNPDILYGALQKELIRRLDQSEQAE